MFAVKFTGLALLIFLSVTEALALGTPVRRHAARSENNPGLSCNDPAYDRKFAEFEGGGAAAPVPAWTSRTESGYRVERKSVTLELAGKQQRVSYNQYHSQTSPSKGTVLFFCGGPGIRCTSEGRPASLPKDVDVILFDYVGLGANKLAHPTAEEMSIETQGELAANLVKKLNLTDYTLYGQSFGTAVGTVAAAKLSADRSAPQPKMLVLDGVLGNQATLDENSARNRVALRAWELLAPAEQRAFKTAYERNVAHLHGERRDEIDLKLTKSVSEGPTAAAENLRQFSRAANGRLRVRPDDGDDDGEPRASAEEIAEWRSAGCQVQGRDQARSNNRYFAGLVPDQSAFSPADLASRCECPTLARAYDSKNFQIRGVPIVYVNSTTDPSTPIEGARHHFNTQNETNQKFFFETKDGGHGELEERFVTCADGIWHATLSGRLELVQRELAAVGTTGCPESPAPPAAPRLNRANR